jgi:hypothetical protein
MSRRRFLSRANAGLADVLVYVCPAGSALKSHLSIFPYVLRIFSVWPRSQIEAVRMPTGANHVDSI